MASSSPLDRRDDSSGLVSLSSSLTFSASKLIEHRDLAITAAPAEGPATETQQWCGETDAPSFDAANTGTAEDAKRDDQGQAMIIEKAPAEYGDQQRQGEDEVKSKDEGEEVPKSDATSTTVAKGTQPSGENPTHMDNRKTANTATYTRERELRAMAYQKFIQGTVKNQDRRALTKEELEGRDQSLREQAYAREERAKRRLEAKLEKLVEQQEEEGQGSRQWPLTKRQEKKQRQLANQKKKREEEEELARLRECERELLALKGSLPRAQGISGSTNSPPKPYQDAQPSGIATRVEVLKRARLEQEQQQPGEDLDRPIASGSALVVKEEASTPGISLIDVDKVTGMQANDVSTSGMILRKMENDNGKFQFELVVNLKGINKRSRPDSQTEDPGPTSPVPENDTNAIPTITKVAISLESAIEYRISVSGERPRKRLRTPKPTIPNDPDGEKLTQ